MIPALYRCFPLAVLLALVGSSAVRADTIYFKEPGVHGIQTVSGTIVRQTESRLEVATEDGDTVIVYRSNVFQIVRDTPSSEGHSSTGDRFETTGLSHLDRRSTRATAPYHYGIKGGLNVSNLRVDPEDLEEKDSLHGFAVGAWWGLPLSRHLNIQAEALYSVKGDSETAGDYTASTRLGYIDVPVVAKVDFLHGARARPSLFLGPSVAINLSARSKLEGDDGDIDVDVKEHVRPVEFGLVVGGGVDFAVGERTYGVDVRYSKGLSDIVRDGANGSAYNDVLAVMGSVGLQ